MDNLSGIPEEVPQEYKDQLLKFQNQIKVLLQNYQILHVRLEKNPEDKKVLEQIDQVKIYLISFSEQQKEVLDKVRNFLSKLEEDKKKSPERESKTSRCSTPKSKGRGKSKSKTKSSKNSSEATSDTSEDEEENDIFLAYLDSDQGYRGHVEDYDIGPGIFEKESEPVEEFYRQIETTETFDNIDKEQFLDAIDLVTEPTYNSTLSRIEELRRRKKFLVVTYIPDIADKKYRYQTFLQNTITSPPHLRRRKPNQLPTAPPRSSPRTIPPLEKMETRNKTLNLFKSQVDGCDDLVDEVDDKDEPLLNNNFVERLEFRNQLLKRKLEMEEEMENLQKKAKILQDKRERQKEEKMLLLKEQKETEQKIFQLLQHISDAAVSSSLN